MSARLTLLVLCDQTELCSVFFSALISADFHLLVAHHAEQAAGILSSLVVDAILIRHHGIPDGSLVGADLKLVAPRTPILLFANEGPGAGPQLGIDSVYYADVQDEVLACAAATFLRQSLLLSRRHRNTRLREENTGFRMPGENRQIAV